MELYVFLPQNVSSKKAGSFPVLLPKVSNQLE